MPVIISCEHASHRIPKQYASLFSGQQSILKSHRGWDIGAARLATRIAHEMHAPVFHGKYSRLLIDLNRSLHHPRLFSGFSKHIDHAEREKIINTYYLPYRIAIEQYIRETATIKTPVVHLSLHSFTPVLNGIERNCDIGLLYDPGRINEKKLSSILFQRFRQELPGFKIRRNYPYRGIADGLASALRKKFSNRLYTGIEIEINQLYPISNGPVWKQLQEKIGAILSSEV